VAGPAPRRRDTVRSGAEPARRADRSRPGRTGARFAVVAARFNERITGKLVDGARRTLVTGGVAPGDVEVHWVPGSFELPQAAAWLAGSGRYAGVVCLGVIIRGETPHFEHVAREAATGIREVAISSGVPVTFGVVTTLDEAQAWARAGGAVANRGEEAAEAALEMAELARTLGVRRGASPRARAGTRRRR
jgi:6,7-dimethyl-8-ribityllumazine synthase